MLAQVPHEFVTFRSIPELLARYAAGGVLISPRFLDNSYNLGHTEWKITLGMACGRLAFCSPVPSYADVAARSGGRGLRICANDAEWDAALDARATVEQHYSTPVVAAQHAELLSRLLSQA